jgi:hypothetical protein
MSKDRLKKCVDYVQAHVADLHWEGMRCLIQEYDATDTARAKRLSDAIELDIKWGSKSESWRNAMRIGMLLAILLKTGDLPDATVAEAYKSARMTKTEDELKEEIKFGLVQLAKKHNWQAADELAKAARSRTCSRPTSRTLPGWPASAGTAAP